MGPRGMHTTRLLTFPCSSARERASEGATEG